MTTSIQPREEVFPGYLLSERIGSGGYAEVWRARAPGGIDKAVKIVFGCYDEQLAVQELKALERIKDVRHPFVLSLERFEIVDGRLAILTELADMSLEQRAQLCRTQGLPGIPREELLRYMADTAEALDYLAERHKLQHLDIKPANLLISGDHVKVADFGLVKELASRTNNSMVAGMTPTYSSPEMFDDAPSPHSDQYSLAIVYQEMLTGILPFPGRTTAQLANQHLHAQPQLASLNEIDRKRVARALAKNPADRFASCRAFVKALIEAVEPPKVVKQAANKASEVNGGRNSDHSGPRVSTMPRALKDGMPPAVKPNKPTQVQSQGTIDTKAEITLAGGVRAAEEVVDVAVPDVASAIDTTGPTLYIAVGGIGTRVLCRLRDSLARRASQSQPSPAVEMMAIDTDRAALKEACSKTWFDPLPAADALCLSLRMPQEYREQSQVNLEWISHRWLYNIPRSLETRGYRPLGRLALVDHLDRVVALLDRKLEQLAAVNTDDGDQPPLPDVRVVLLTGTGGGTGGGMAMDLANLARSRIQSAGRRGKVQGILICTCLGNTSASPLSVANSYALLAELRFVSRAGNQSMREGAKSLPILESRDRPFDLVYFQKPVHRADHSVDDDLNEIAKHLALSSTNGMRQMLDCCRQAATPQELARQEPLWLRTFGCAPLVGPVQNRVDRMAKRLAHLVEQKWLASAGASEWRRLDRAGMAQNSLETPAAHCDSGEGAKMAPAVARSQTEEWRSGFGPHGSSQFAFDVVARICRQSTLRGEGRKPLLSATDPARLIEIAAQGVSSIGTRAGESPQTGAPLSDEDEAIVNELTASSSQMLAKLIDEMEQSSADSPPAALNAHRVVLADCLAAIEARLGCLSNGSSDDENSTVQSEMEHALAAADVDLLQCGYDRRTLIVVPTNCQTGEAIEALKNMRPTAAVVPADVDESIVFCEGSGINPASLARGFERVYPGIAEAAGRLFTRNDIDWSTSTP